MDSDVTSGVITAKAVLEPTDRQRWTTRAGLVVAISGLGLALLADALLRQVPWGVNIVLWVAVAVAAVVFIGRRLGIDTSSKWLLMPALFFAVGLAWRDSSYLRVINTVALFVALAVAGGADRILRVRSAGFIEFAGSAGRSLGAALGGAGKLLTGDIRWDLVPRGDSGRRIGGVARGVLIAIPLMIVFGALFVSADAVFQKQIEWLFDWDMESLVYHLLTISGVFWVTAGFLRQIFIRPEVSFGGPDSKREHVDLATEVAVVLGLLNLLFLAFVVTQIRHLFGAVVVHTGLELSDIARHGYFELLTVCGISLPVLLLADVGVRNEGRTPFWYKALAGALVAMLGVILFSAFLRLRLLVESTGLSELRIFSLAFQAWLVAVWIWFAATVLRGRPERFAFGCLVAGVATVVVMNAINPDAVILRVNTANGKALWRYDTNAMPALSADSLPTLIQILPRLPMAQRGPTEIRLLKELASPADTDWRRWNWGRMRGRQAIQDQAAMIRTLHP